MPTMFKVKNHEETSEYTALGAPEAQKTRKSTSATEMESQETLLSSKEEEHDAIDRTGWRDQPGSTIRIRTSHFATTSGDLGESVFPGSCDGTCDAGALQIDEQPFSIGAERRSGPLFGSEVTLEAVLFSMKLDIVFSQQLQSPILR